MRKKIVIIGGTGFIGYNLAKELKNYKFEIHSLSSKFPINIRKIARVKYIISDLSNTSELKKKIKSNYEYVINLSGNINHKNKKETFKVHYKGLKNLANFFCKKNIKLFIQIGSSLEYGKAKSPQKEAIKCRPVSNYGKAKFLATKYLMLLIKKKNFPCVILRPYQIYGPKQKLDRLIPSTINFCKKNLAFKCTEGSQLRDFLHIDDFTNLIVKILKKEKNKFGIYNVGFGKANKVRQVINIIQKTIGKGHPLFGSIKMRKDEIKVLFPSIKKVSKEYNWKPNVRLKKGLLKII